MFCVAVVSRVVAVADAMEWESTVLVTDRVVFLSGKQMNVLLTGRKRLDAVTD